MLPSKAHLLNLSVEREQVELKNDLKNDLSVI